jgi:hypothetical protein
MKMAKTLMATAMKAGKMKKPRLSLGDQTEKGGVDPNGPHRIRIVADGRMTTVLDRRIGKDVEAISVPVEEGGIEKEWVVRVKDPEGNLHYLIPKLAELEPGDEVVVEMMRRGLKAYISVKKAGKEVGGHGDGEENRGRVGDEEAGSDLPREEGEELDF